MTVRHICDILLSRDRIWNTKNPIEKGKPFERMGHKALEPKSPEGLMVVSCQKDKINCFKKAHFSMENELFLLPCLCPKRAQMNPTSPFGDRNRIPIAERRGVGGRDD